MALPSNRLRSLKAELARLVSELDESIPKGRLQLKKDVELLGSMLSTIEGIGKAKMPPPEYEDAGVARILAYLRLFVGQVIERRELQAVAAIDDWPRRVRELRVQEGYKIVTGLDRDDIRPDQYVLEDAEPDLKKGAEWKAANSIRKKKGAAWKRMLELLLHYLKKPVKSEALYYVAQIKDYQRRLRELRTQHGYRVVTSKTGRPGLAVDDYLLETDVPLPQHDRLIKAEVYDEVLSRDRYACKKCGWKTSDYHPAARKQYLEVHHKVLHSKGGSNTAENLVTICNVHHDDIHRDKIDENRIDAWLKEK